jgi:hypothetical protein
MKQPWEITAEAAGFRKAGVTTSSTESEAYGAPKLVGPPIMAAGYMAIVHRKGAVILGPKGAFSISWPLSP